MVYLGYNGDGHFGRLNLTASAYYALGHQDHGLFINESEQIRAGFLAAEASMDFDWIRVRASAAYASGVTRILLTTTRRLVFDTVFENPIFAGADTSYWISQALPLIGGGGVALRWRQQLDSRICARSKEQGQSKYENPGLRLVGLGADFDLTPTSRVSANLNQLWFDNTAVLEVLRAASPISRSIGTDASVAWIYRPFFTQNIVFRLSGSELFAGTGLKNLYGTEHSQYFAVLANVILTY